MGGKNATNVPVKHVAWAVNAFWRFAALRGVRGAERSVSVR